MLYSGSSAQGHECVSLWEANAAGQRHLAKIVLAQHYAAEIAAGELSFVAPPWVRNDLRPPVHERLRRTLWTYLGYQY